ncbi:amino acid adenylation domain-containing protein, partial [Streptomyces sp. NPDC006012]|uniref:non-ribosomal peptide synthetase n=1 Tax=Streptomyces sp. NPDC006012 TaxID=3364739 RepID=UPI0036CAAF11
MGIEELYVQFGLRSVKIRRDGENIAIRAPKNALDAAFVQAVRDNKHALLEQIDRGGLEWWSPATVITPPMLPLVSLTQEQIDLVVAAVPGGTPNVQDIYPLGPLQEGILFHHLLGGDGDAYLLSSLIAFDDRGLLDQFTGALQQVMNRHDILRTSVVWEGLPQPVQVVHRWVELPVDEIGLDAGDVSAADQLRERFHPSRFRLDLRRAPWLRGVVAHDEENGRWLMLVLLHHMAGDHTTFDVLQEEIAAIATDVALPTPVPYRNVVAQALLGVSEAEHRSFFSALLRDVDEPTAPFGLLDVRGDGTDVTEAVVRISDPVARALRNQARRLGTSTASLFHLAWAQVLARVTGRDDVVFGTVLFGRMHGGAGAERGLGLFINTLPVRIAIGRASVETDAQETHRQLTELLRHEHASLTLAQQASAVAPSAPLFTSLLNYRHSGRPLSSRDAADVWRGVEFLDSRERTNYPVVISVDDLGEGFTVTAQIADDDRGGAAVDPARVGALLASAVEKVVQTLEQAPRTPAGELDILPQAEHDLLTTGFNTPRTPLGPTPTTPLTALFQDRVAAAPDAVAVVHGGRSLTYAELNARANRLAHALRSAGVGPDVLVGVCAERGLDLVVALLGVLKAGGAYVPLDPAYPVDRLAHMLSDSAPRAVVTAGAGAVAVMEELAGELPVLDLAELDAGDGVFAGCPESDPVGVGLRPEHLAYVIYTSGSTGVPKGVMVEHRNVSRLFSATDAWFGFGADDVWTLAHSYAFDFSVWELWGALLHGGRLVVVPADVVRSPEDLYALVCAEGVTVLSQTPSAFAPLVRAQSVSEAGHRLRLVVFGGEALEPASLRPWFEQNPGAGTRLVNMYGITETTVHVTYRPVSEEDVDSVGSPIGVPIPDLRVHVLDPQGRPAPVGVAGEMFVGGAGVARGYLNRPELTAERFVVVEGERFYRSGDLGRWRSDGSLEYLGRNDFQVKVRGFRIELGEIEARLLDHPGIREAVVVPREDVPGDQRLVAYYVAGPDVAGPDVAGPDVAGPDVSVEGLRVHLARSLPDYMVPAAFVALASVPLTVNGKLDRRALPAPDASASRAGEFVAAQGAVEEALAGVWSQVLGVDRVGRHDNFFELGGHSLLAVTLVGRLREAGFAADVRTVFTAPTVAALAVAMAGAS